MKKWFEAEDMNTSSILSSRIRIARNWDACVFPSRLSREKACEMLGQLKEGVLRADLLEGEEFPFFELQELKPEEKQALFERRILNREAFEGGMPAGLFVSRDEGTSLVLGVNDHFRLQLLGSSLSLKALLARADRLDDRLNGQFTYAFDEKYGYLTSFPTNVGTGLRASVLIHLPVLSQVRKFQGIVNEISRFGTVIRGAYAEGNENYGSIYELSNQRTLGLSEQDIVDFVTKAALQLNARELRVRAAALNSHRLEREDEAYKSYGILKYARSLTEKDARIFLSQLMEGEQEGVISFKEKVSLFGIMLAVKPANLNVWAKKTLDGQEQDVVRALYIRVNLPELKEP